MKKLFERKEAGVGAVARGFTLIELLIVIAILGALAAIVLVAVNPAQRLAQTRDANRKSQVTQIGHSLEAYATQNSGKYVAELKALASYWLTYLVESGDLPSASPNIAYSGGLSACVTNNPMNGYCYDTAGGGDGTSPVVLYVKLESKAETSKCTVTGDVAYFVYSTSQGRAGIFCKASTSGEPVNTDSGGTLL